MFEVEDEGDSWWTPSKRSAGEPNKLPLEWNATVEGIPDSTVRYVVDPSGMHHQVISSEPHGHPRISMHQNHYAVPTSAGAILGSVDFSARDQLATTMTSYIHESWTPSSHPAGICMRVTAPGTTVPRYPALTLCPDGRVAMGGGPAALTNSLVSLGVYRRGIFELPRVERYEDLLTPPQDSEAFVNGAIVYARDLDRVLISQGGSWHAILTTPVSSLLGSKSEPPLIRQMGEPRKDGLPTVFGPRMGFRR